MLRNGSDMGSGMPPDPNHGDDKGASDSLAVAVQRVHLDITPEQVAQLDAYRERLWQHNENVNLTRHTTFDKFVSRDIIDSKALADLIPTGRRVLDVGTGGGVPGIVLAILRPDLKVSLSESVGKKATIVQSIVRDIRLPIEVYHARAEDVLEGARYHTLVARAVAPLARILHWLAPHWDSFDELLLIKGRSWIEERADARRRGLLAPLELRRVATFTTPLTGGESVVLRLWKAAEMG